MLPALFLLLLAQPTGDRWHDRIRPTPASFAYFEFAPPGGAGMGAACAGTTPTGSKGETLTGFTRGSSATCLKTVGAPQLIANGDMVTLTSNQPRVMPGADGTGVNGLLLEPSRTNVALRSQQLENAVWTVANAGVAAPTVTADQAVAPDGTTTAERVQVPATTVAGGQYSFVYQTTANVNPGSGGIYFRGNGTSGTIGLALFGNGGWHDLGCPYVSTGWTPCANENIGAVGAPVADIGIGNFSGLAVSGAVDRGAQDVFVWGAQLEQGAAVSSYIATTSASVTRSADAVPYVTLGTSISGAVSVGASFVAPVAGHANGDGVFGFSPSSAPSAPGIAVEYDATTTTSAPYTANAPVPTTMGCYRQAGDLVGYTQDTDGLGGTQSSVGRVWCATSGAAGNQFFFGQLTGFYPTASRGFALASSNVVTIGSWSTAASPFGGVIKKVCVDPNSARCASGALGASRIAWDGDSITYGFPNPPTSPAVQLTQLLGPQGRTVTNAAINGSVAGDCAARWTSKIQGQGYSTLVWSCAVNDIATSNTGAATAATVETTLAAALADGERVIVTGIIPWKSSASWTSGRNTEGLAYNSLISAWAGAHGATFVDTSSMGGQGGDPDALLAAYNSGDAIHLSVAGQLKFAQLVQAVSP